MTLLSNLSAVHEGRHQLSPYLMPVRYLKMTRSIPKGELKSGFAAGGVTTDEKSYHFSGTGSKDRSQACRRTPDVPKAWPDARQSGRKRVQPGSNYSLQQLYKTAVWGSAELELCRLFRNADVQIETLKTQDSRSKTSA